MVCTVNKHFSELLVRFDFGFVVQDELLDRSLLQGSVCS